jgi:hypothetical protein
MAHSQTLDETQPADAHHVAHIRIWLYAVAALVHGVINHGWQYVDPKLRRQPISYFGPGSGIAKALGIRTSEVG